MKHLEAILNWLFGCHHRHMSRVWTIPPGSQQPYVTCLDCGAEFQYDWGTMKIGQELPR